MSTNELNDDLKINVKLTNPSWNIILDWLAHTPYEEARTILKELNDQIQAAESSEIEKEFTASLMIKQFNALIFGLGQAPYILVAEIVQQIYAQGLEEIQRHREQNIQVAVEKSELNPDNISIETTQPAKKTSRRKVAKKAAE